MEIEVPSPFNDPEIREEYDGWLDAIQASADADIAYEQFLHNYNETSKLLAGGVFDTF